MEMKSNEIGTKHIGNITTTHFQHNDANTLAIILPGAGYTAQAPLLYYSTNLLVQKGIDVVHVNYKFSREVLASLKDEEFAEDIREIILNVQQQYDKVIIVGKSIGTIPLAYLSKDKAFADSIFLWLTPLIQVESVFKALRDCTQPSLAIIGDKDPCYIAERWDSLLSNNNVSGKLISDADHGLEVKMELYESMDLMKDVIKMVDSFVDSVV